MNAGHRIDVLLRTTSRRRPPVRALRTYAQAALATLRHPVALSIALVGDAEMATLNARFRGVARSTNVLAFAAEPASGDDPEGPELLGDVVVCVPVVVAEAARYDVSRDARFAHMLVHGVLHLLGHDHDETAPRRRMERSERRLLAGLGFGDPYESATHRPRP